MSNRSDRHPAFAPAKSFTCSSALPAFVSSASFAVVQPRVFAMVATIETLPNEVLEIIFSELSGLPKLPMPGWRMLDEPDWVNNLRDVVNLSCTSKRLCTVGQDQRQAALYLRQGEANGFAREVAKGFEARQLFTVRQLYVHIHDNDDGDVAARLLGERLHLLPSLKHLYTHFTSDDTVAQPNRRPCCGPERDFCRGIEENIALDKYALSPFLCRADDMLACSDVHIWQAVAKLNVRDLAFPDYPSDQGAPRCPTVRRLAVGYFEAVTTVATWRPLTDLEEFWLFDDFGVCKGARLNRLPKSVHTLAVPGCTASDIQAVLEALTSGNLRGLRRFMPDLPCSGWCEESPEVFQERDTLLAGIDEVLRARGRKTELLGGDEGQAAGGSPGGNVIEAEA